MKRIILVFIAFITLTFASCTSRIEREISKKITTDEVFVDKMKVKKIDINKDFYKYDIDYVKSLREKEDIEHKLSNCRIDLSLSKSDDMLIGIISDYRGCNSKDELIMTIANKEVRLLNSFDSINRVIENIAETYPKKGKLYSAKILTKNKYGGYYSQYMFKVYYRGLDGELHEYWGEDFGLIKNSTFPSSPSSYGGRFLWMIED